jgi:hypothetical protein
MHADHHGTIGEETASSIDLREYAYYVLLY